MPSTFKHPAHVPMWKGAKVAYFFIATCLFPVAIGGFWAYGNLVSNTSLQLDPSSITYFMELTESNIYIIVCRRFLLL